MSSVIAKTSTGEIWKDTNSGKIIKAKQISEETLLDGKVSEFVAGDWTLVENGCSVWNDSVGSNDLYQDVVASRLEAMNDVDGIPYLNGVGNSGRYLKITGTINAMSFMLVTGHVASFVGVAPPCIFGRSFNHGEKIVGRASAVGTPFVTSNAISTYNTNTLQYSSILNKINNVNYELNTNRTSAQKLVFATAYDGLVDFSRSFFTWHNSNTGYLLRSWHAPIYHLVFYNKVLNDMEITYNTNALKKRYNIA
jgi:hypothetical protein